jgi:AraC-like DNA-binding protein
MQSVTGRMSGHAISAVAEREMRRWAHDLERQQHAVTAQPKRVEELVHPFIAISREAGVDAADLAAAVSKKCGWKVFDRELLDYLAEHDHLSRLALEFVDERTVSWFHEMFGKWLEKHLVSQAEYVSRLGKLVLLSAQHESSIFIGRGAQFMLPRERGIVVRLIAPEKERLARLAKRSGKSARETKRMLSELDTSRAQFVQRYFHHDIADPYLYDLVINLGYIPREEAAEIIASRAKEHAARSGDTSAVK